MNKQIQKTSLGTFVTIQYLGCFQITPKGTKKKVHWHLKLERFWSGVTHLSVTQTKFSSSEMTREELLKASRIRAIDVCTELVSPILRFPSTQECRPPPQNVHNCILYCQGSCWRFPQGKRAFPMSRPGGPDGQNRGTEPRRPL